MGDSALLQPTNKDELHKNLSAITGTFGIEYRKLLSCFRCLCDWSARTFHCWLVQPICNLSYGVAWVWICYAQRKRNNPWQSRPIPAGRVPIISRKYCIFVDRSMESGTKLVFLYLTCCQIHLELNTKDWVQPVIAQEMRWSYHLYSVWRTWEVG